MENKQPISHFSAGIVLALILIIYSLILNFSGLSERQDLRIVNLLIILSGLIWFIQLYGKAKNNFVTFSELFTYGFRITAIITLVFILFIVVYNLAFPEFKARILETARQKMEADGKLSSDEIEKAVKMTSRFVMVGIIGFVLFFFLIAGGIGSLLGAALTKKKPFKPLEQLNL